MNSNGDIFRQIKERADLVEIIGRSVTLRKAGTSYLGLCPFHKEKSPSFNVVPGKQIFHCFGCGAGGSVIDWVMRTERLELREALEKLAADLGIEMARSTPEDKRAREVEQKRANDLQSANAEALAWFRGNLLEGANKLATAYLPERGLTEDLSEQFQLGAALDEWDGLKRHLLSIGYTEDLLVDGGLCVRSENGRVYDRFRNRLIFPIFDANGRVCGFGGRQLVKEDNSPKYLNSAETALYKKSQMLYGLNIARKDIETSGYAIICEGYMDVIMAHAHGHRQAVASLGTALTVPQAKLLRRYANRTYFLYDGDAAGQKAMLRGGEALMDAGLDTRVLSLPPEDDPDTFLRREGGNALHDYFEHAEEFFDYAVRCHSSNLDIATLAGQAELVERLSGLFAVMKNEVVRESAMARLLRKLGGLPREALNRILARAAKAQESRYDNTIVPAQASAPGQQGGSGSRPVAATHFDKLESGLLKLMVESPAALQYIRARLRHEWITDSRLEGWIFFLADNEGYAQSLLNEAEATGNLPGLQAVIPAILAMDMPEKAKTEAAAREVLMRLHERHQQVLSTELLSMIDRRDLPEEEERRLLTAFDQENKLRMEKAGRHIRVGDSARRRERFTQNPKQH